VLDHNRRDGWTCPSAELYPHQWLWDSCFTAIGLTHVDPARAADELRSLVRGQWDDGMVPHMVFAPGSRDLGNRTIWRSRRRAGAPRDVDTTCITQPPLLAIATARVAAALDEPERGAFLGELFPRLVRYHEWIYRERVVDDTGLVTLLHPWESGLDSTPPWMHALRGQHLPLWLRIAARLHLARLLRRLRYDTRQLPAAERATDDDGFLMLAAAVRAGKHDFVLRRMPRDGSALLQDVGFNSMLVAANHALTFLAHDLGEDLPSTLVTAMDRTPAAIETLWDEGTGLYCSRDAVSGELLATPTIAGFLPLWAGVPTAERAAQLVTRLRSSSFRPPWPVPSVALDAPEFRAVRYWKGPTWVNTNWMLVDALHAYGHTDLAEELREQTIAMVATAGPYEYFSPLDGSGHGAPEFSWTAALTLDLSLD
jgi:glycogen debranching enzyme